MKERNANDVQMHDASNKITNIFKEYGIATDEEDTLEWSTLVMHMGQDTYEALLSHVNDKMEQYIMSNLLYICGEITQYTVATMIGRAIARGISVDDIKKAFNVNPDVIYNIGENGVVAAHIEVLKKYGVIKDDDEANAFSELLKSAVS